MYVETPRPNTNRHVHAYKCLHCAGIEPATSCVVGEYYMYFHFLNNQSNGNARQMLIRFFLDDGWREAIFWLEVITVFLNTVYIIL
jgi:hypothetical protein